MTHINIEGFPPLQKFPYEEVKNLVVQVKGKWYFKSSNKIVKVKDGFALKEEVMTLLPEKLYGKHYWASNEHITKLHSGENALKRDAVTIKGKVHFRDNVAFINGEAYLRTDERVTFDNYSGEYILKADAFYLDGRYYRKKDVLYCCVTNKPTLRSNLIPVRLFKDASSYVDLAASKEAFITDAIKPLIINIRDPLTNAWNSAICRHDKSKSPFLYYEPLDCYFADEKTLSSCISPLQKKALMEVSGDIRGGEVYHKPQLSAIRRSSINKSLGYMHYSFGIEFETCNGIIPNFACDLLSVSKVGDGSTRRDDDRVVHYEYVTDVLKGTRGLRHAIRTQSFIRSYTEFNNKCSTHIHIGGVSSDNPPVMNRQFSAYCINLGMQIEPTLAKIIPKWRHPLVNRYCASIRRRSLVNVMDKKSINNACADFIFNQPSLGRKVNKKSGLGRWTEGRYKWLNLVNAGSDTGRETVEFRIFPATDNPDFLKMYILISMAFVYFVENFAKKITSQNNTLFSMLEDVYKDRSPALYEKFILPTLEKLLALPENEHTISIPDHYNKEYSKDELNKSCKIVAYTSKKKVSNNSDNQEDFSSFWQSNAISAQQRVLDALTPRAGRISDSTQMLFNADLHNAMTNLVQPIQEDPNSIPVPRSSRSRRGGNNTINQ